MIPSKLEIWPFSKAVFPPFAMGAGNWPLILKLGHNVEIWSGWFLIFVLVFCVTWLVLLLNVSFYRVRFSFLTAMSKDLLGRMSLQWPVLCRVGRKTFTEYSMLFHLLSIIRCKLKGNVYDKYTVHVWIIIWLEARLRPNVGFTLRCILAVFGYNSTKSELIWIKSGVLWVHFSGLPLADFGCNPHSSGSWRARRFFLSGKQHMILLVFCRSNFTKCEHNTSIGVTM